MTGYEFLKSLIGHGGDECVVWPKFRDANGYGRVKRPGNNSVEWAHRVMCELANGLPPTDEHHASHNCGKGNEGYVNPNHLQWKTRSENQLDRRTHGTKAFGAYRWPGRKKLTERDVMAIKTLKGRATQRQIAKMFNITDATVRDIYSGKSWRNVS